MAPSRPRSPLALVLLALLAEAPMHPYRMQQLIRERGKDRIANVAQPNSVYQTIDRLHRAGLIAVRATARHERRPERTEYELTDDGRAALDTWLKTVLSTPPREFPDFPAALSLLSLLEPADARALLEARVHHLTQRLAELTVEIESLPRLFLIEDEYQRAVTEAELGWVQAIVDDLRSGRLSWDPAELRAWAAEQRQALADPAQPVGQTTPAHGS
jgi:DNA-binding PadR family transcriptional regulator